MLVTIMRRVSLFFFLAERLSGSTSSGIFSCGENAVRGPRQADLSVQYLDGKKCHISHTKILDVLAMILTTYTQFFSNKHDDM